MLPTSRVNRTRPPLAEMSKFSFACAAVEQQRVGAVLALDHVAAVARIPLEDVVAGAEQGRVVALVAVDEVVAVAAEKEVGAVAAEDGVVAGAAVDRHADEGRQIAGGAEAVVAAVHVEHEVFGRPDVDAERRGIDAVEAHARAVGGGGEDLRAVAAVDLDGVGAVAALGQIGVVAGFQIMRSSPASPNIWSSPSPPVSVSLPSPPCRRSAPWLPTSVSLPAPPSRVSFVIPAGTVAADIVSLPPPPLTTRASFAPSDAVMFTRACRPATAAAVPDPSTLSTSSPFVAVHGHGVGLRRRRRCRRSCRRD